MINDFEYLYMIRQHDEDAFFAVLDKFNRLIWKRAHDLLMAQKPQGIVAADLYQEGFIGFYESLYSFNESKEVGFAFYVNLCVVSCIKTALRKCRGQSYRLLDNRFSFDMAISEDESLFLADVVESDHQRYNPQFMAVYYEAEQILEGILRSLTPLEQHVYRLRDLGYSYQEIAQQLDITPKHVDNIIQKVRRKMSG